MQTKLTLRVEESVVRKAKSVANHRGASVSKLFGDFINQLPNEGVDETLPPQTAAMLGVLKSGEGQLDESDYRAHLEDKYLS